jgi:hypothetical protein
VPARGTDEQLAAAIAARHASIDEGALRQLLADSATAASSPSNQLAGGAALTLVQRLHAIASAVAPPLPRSTHEEPDVEHR